MIRRLVSVSVLAAILLSLFPISSGANESLKPSAQSGIVDQRSWLAGLRSYAAFGNWLLSKLPGRAKGESELTATPPVKAFLNPVPFFLNAPTNLAVTATSDTQVAVSWTAPVGSVDHYQVERSQSLSGPFLFVANAAVTSFSDTTVTTDHAYLYRVRAVASGGTPSLPSNMAFGTATSFEFSALAGQEIKAQHFYDVRTAVNAVRVVAGLIPASWARGALTGLEVKADDVNEMRAALDAALSTLSIPVTSYDDSTLSVGVTLIKAVHLEQLQTRSTRGSSTSAGPLDSDASSARVDPMNETGGGGENPLSRNFNWNLPLVSLPGRAGMNLGLSLSYNSLVWTLAGTSISFDSDRGFPSAGFRLGFPVIQSLYYNSEVGKYAFLLISPDGSHTELRQVNTSTLYEAADSSHLLLDASTMTLRTTDGTQLTYVSMGGEYNCTQIKDRNGNYITVNYTPSGRIDTVVDTLARSIKFNYDASGSLTSITQIWNQGSANQVTHNWATFMYVNTTIQTNFPGLSIYGPANNSTIKTLASVTLADGSHSDFSYTSWGQVWKISGYAADNHLLNYRSYKLPGSPLLATGPQADCPRFTERHDWAQYWNGDTDGAAASNEEAVTAFAEPTPNTNWTMPDGTSATGTRAQVTAPDGTSNKIYFIGAAGTASGWKRSLPALVNTYDSTGALQRQAMTTWTQDNTAVSYQLNPRVTETNIYDPAGNRARTQITYQQFTFANGTSCFLPIDVYEYAADATTKLRSTRTDYNTSTSYTDRRILGLVSERRLYEGDVNNGGVLRSKVGFNYDESGSLQGTDAPVQHDNTNYSAAFVTGRGNLSSVKRYDVSNTGLFTTTSTKYNTAGAVASIKDALNHEITISYVDVFSDGITTHNTLAYPTKLTDPDGYYSIFQYNFDFGATTYRQSPPPNYTGAAASQPTGPAQSFEYFEDGRLKKQINLVNNAYTRYQYPASQIRVDTFSTVVANKGEAYSFQILDGFGRPIATASDHPATTGTNARFDAWRTAYDVMGRVIKTSNPAETSAIGDDPAQWQLVEGDAGSNWAYSQYTYDWKGRPKITTNTDGTTKSATYEGCGCAGGEVVTLNDEGTIVNGVTKTRQKKIYSDVLGRTVKTEVWNFDGTGPGGVGRAIYATTVSNYNVRDQATLVRQFKGAAPANYLTDLSCPTGTCQKTEFTYDGYGRLQTKHEPEQQQNPYVVTSWTYNADDTVNTITDGRGAVTAFGYGTSGNNRRLVKTISHTLSGSLPINVSFDYDAVGNQKSMSHSINGIQQDSCDYTYDQLSRLTSETRHINALANSATAGDYTVGYQYTLGGQVSSVTDPFGSTTNLNYDAIGRTESVTGSYAGTSYTYADDVEYRAWGVVKRHGAKTITYNSRLQPTQFRYFQYRYDYNYHPDGQLKHLTDLDDLVGQPSQVTFHYMSRDYGYDVAGRLSRVDATNNPTVSSGGIIPAPFVGHYGYDEFNNLISRTGHYALNTDSSDSGTYVDNKRTNPGWSYDADGRVLASVDTATTTSQTWSYDAAGNQISISEVGSGTTSTNTLSYDGDGELLFESVMTPQSTKADYLIRSRVLGAVITKLDASGNKDITYVPANGLAFPMQTKDSNGNPTVGGVTRDVTGLQEDGKAVDPFGALIQNVQPPTSGPPPNMPFYGGTYGGVSWNQFTNANNYSSGCTLDGVRTPCQNALGQVAHGNAFVTSLSTTGTLAEFFNAGLGGLIGATQRGYSGYKDDKKYGLITSASLRPHEIGNTIAYFLPDSAGEWADIAWTPTNFLFVDNLNLGPAFGPDPQNPVVALTPEQTAAIRNQIAGLLTDKCAKFIDQIVSSQTGKPYHSKTSLLTDFNSIRDGKGGFFFGGTSYGGDASGSLSKGNGTVRIANMYSFSDSSKAFGAAFVALHEILHIIAGAGDQTLSERVRDLGITVTSHPGHTSPYPTDPDNRNLAYSGYWGQALKNACDPKGY